MTLRAELRENWRSNRWLRREVACLPLWVAWMALAWWFTLGFVGFVVGVMLIAAFAGCGWKAVRTSAALRSAAQAESARLAKQAAVLRTPRAPDAGPDQCPVCGGYGLDALAADDRFMERGPDRAKVVAYGPWRAHWDCAEFVPYQAPKQNAMLSFEIDGVRTYARYDDGSTRGAYSHCKFCNDYMFGRSLGESKEMLISHSKLCPKRPRPSPALAFEVDGHPTYTGHAHEGQNLRLAAGAMKGAMSLLLDGVAPANLFLIQDAALQHMEIVDVTRIGGSGRSGYGVSVGLTEPLRHSFPADTKLTPVDSKRLWNWTESRPYTRTELGLCDCAPELSATRLSLMLAEFAASESARFEGKLRASIDPSVFRMLGDGF